MPSYYYANVLVACLLVSSTVAFTAPSTPHAASSSTRLYNVGGWGNTNSRELTDGEYGRRERRAFEPFQLSDPADFARQVREEQQRMKNEEKEELLAVARMAGIDVDEKRRSLGKFDDEDLDMDDDLDLSVPFDDPL